MSRIYIAGPMTGIPQFNFPAFDAAAIVLRERGFEVVSPAELDDPDDRAAAFNSPDGSALAYGNGVKKTWGQFLGRDVILIADSKIEAIYVLEGWNKSRGARLETFVGAAMCGLPIYHFDDGSKVSAFALVKAWAGGFWTDAIAQLFGHSAEVVR